MLDFIPFKSLLTVNINLGPSFTGIGRLGNSVGPVAQEQIAELSIPWQQLLPAGEIFSLLSWHTRVSDFVGRDDEIAELRKWAETDYPIWVKFVIGDGGVGKSRLGAEFSEAMKADDWAAGFANLREPQDFPMKKAGTILIVDYPEENVEGVKELLRDLTSKTPASPLRILFLSRRGYENWEEVVSACNAFNIVDKYPVYLNRLDPPSAHNIYHTTLDIAAETLGTVPAPVSEEALADWLTLASENYRALFIMAAAVHSAVFPEDEVVRYSGSDVIKALVDREVGRFIRIAEDRKFKDKYALARLMAMAAIADEISISEIHGIIAGKKLPLGFQPDDDIKGGLSTAALLEDDRVHAPKPDIVAAAFAADVFSRDPQFAPECIWAALEHDLEGGLERIGRLCHDAEVILSIKQPCLSDWMADAVRGDFDRCQMLDDFFSSENIPLGWLKTAVTICRSMLDHTKDDEERSRILNNLSVNLGACGDTAAALQASKDAVEVYRRLAIANPARFESDLAASLNNLSNRLSDSGHTFDALQAVQESVEIRRRLVAASPARFEPNLAMSLNNLSNLLSDTGDTAPALQAGREAVALYRKLSAANPARFEPDLAMSLNNISIRLSNSGESAEALQAIKEAVEVYRKLAAASPARFEPDLAVSLSTLSNRLSDSGDLDGALQASKEAVEIRRRLAAASPARFEPDLAASLNNLSIRLSNSGESAEALQANNEAVEVYRKLAAASPARFEPDLAMSLNNLSNCLSDRGDRAGALEAIKEAVMVYRRLAAASPARFEPDLAMSFGTRGRIYLVEGKNEEAAASFKEGMEFIRPYAEKLPGSPHEKLYKILESDYKWAIEKSK